ncbi:LysE family translocator [Rhizobium sp. CFBP 8762]|nr:LysE family translocator [Rhizobium sp. CFBP 8762]
MVPAFNVRDVKRIESVSDISSFYHSILAVYAAYILLILSPGPATFAIMSASMARGRKAGIATALGIFAGSFTWGLSAAFGLAAILKTYGSALEILKIFGGLYLLYLAYKAFRAARTVDAPMTVGAVSTSDMPMKTYFLRGYAIHLTNPKAIFGWLSLIALGVPQGAPASITFVIVGGCMALGFTAFMGYALLFSTHRAAAIYRSLRRWIEGTMAGFYGIAGLRLLTARL